MRSRLFLGILFMFFTLGALAACDDGPSQDQDSGPAPAQAREQDEGPVPGDILLKGSSADASNLLPALASDTASFSVIEMVYNALVKVGPNLDIVPDLAESWDVSEDDLTITFHLRRNVRWHDGEPFTARDVMYTYQAMIDPNTPTAYAENFKQVKEAKVIDDYTFQVVNKQPYARALITWGMEIMPAHLLEGKDVTTSDLARKPIGTGPYRFKEWETGQKLVLEANPDYFGGAPYISQLVTRVIPDPATMFLELKSGGVDWMTLTPDQYARQAVGPEFEKKIQKIQVP